MVWVGQPENYALWLIWKKKTCANLIRPEYNSKKIKIGSPLTSFRRLAPVQNAETPRDDEPANIYQKSWQAFPKYDLWGAINRLIL